MTHDAVPPIHDVPVEPLPNAQPEVEYDYEKAAAFKSQIEARQNLPLAIAAGLVAAVLGAIVWAAVTVATQYQIGWMAVGLGFLVGISVRKFGKGISRPFGIVGAVCALFGCVLGNVLSMCGFLSIEDSQPFFVVLVSLLQQPMAIVELLRITVSPMDFLFYAIAVYEGYKFSFREITAEELSSLTKPVEPATV